MATYIVTYDLYAEGQKYSCLTSKMERYSTKWRFQKSCWIVVTSETAAQVRDHLNSCLDQNDKLFVGKLSGEAAWAGYSAEGTSWLKKVLT